MISVKIYRLHQSWQSLFAIGFVTKSITVSQIPEVRTPQHIDTKKIDFCSITAIIHSVNTLPKMIDCLSKYKIKLSILQKVFIL